MDTAAQVARVHTALGVFSTPVREPLRVTGRDRTRFLQGMLSNDVAALRPGDGCHAAWLTNKGKVLADVGVACEEDALWLLCPPGRGEAVRSGLDRYVIADDVTVEAPADLAVVAVAGLAARGALGAPALPRFGVARLAVAGAPVRAFGWREAGEEGYLLLCPAGAAAAVGGALAGGSERIGAEAFEVLRIEAGVPRCGADFGEDTLLLEAGLGADVVSMTKGCYIGQETVARQHSRGHLNRDLRGLRIAGETAPAHGDVIAAAARPDAGVVTSACRSPRHGVIALATLHRSVWGVGTPVEVAHAGGTLRALVVELPFEAR
ncbi:MAG TPA: glycine cleavage T C-terminal barrel domain-containing protein [Polyangia bacterium]|jgi:folate-binding protein YgfZ